VARYLGAQARRGEPLKQPRAHACRVSPKKTGRRDARPPLRAQDPLKGRDSAHRRRKKNANTIATDRAPFGPDRLECRLHSIENQRATNDDERSTDFGFNGVRRGTRRAAWRGVRLGVADRYDMMNDLIVRGMHGSGSVSRWTPGQSGAQVRPRLDVAGGSGDLAAGTRPQVGGERHWWCSPTSRAMLRRGSDRLDQCGPAWATSSTCRPTQRSRRSPTADRMHTIGLRPAQGKRQGSQAHRHAPRPSAGGQLLVLEFSHPRYGPAAQHYTTPTRFRVCRDSA